MAVQRHFLGWSEGTLRRAADFLFRRYAGGDTSGEWNMDKVTVVLPGRRAVRTLQKLLWELAQARRVALVPPTLETISHLPEQLYPARRPLASDVVQQVAWRRVVAETPDDVLRQLIVNPPEKNSSGAWQLANALRTLHQELAGEGYRFQDLLEKWDVLRGRWPADVIKREKRRWAALQNMQERYLRLMDSLGLWDTQTARLVAVEKRECSTSRDIVLVGTVDINRTVRRMVEQVAERTTALVFAPETSSHLFDEIGCLDVEAWSKEPLPIRLDHVEMVDGPTEQALRVAEIISNWAKTYAPDEIVVGVPDENLVPYLVRCLEGAGACARWGPGRPASTTRVGLLLETAVSYVTQQDFATFAALVRHPDVTRWLTNLLGTPQWLLECDRYCAERLPRQAGPPWLGPENEYMVLRDAWQKIAQWLAPLGESRQSPQNWSKAIGQILESIYANEELAFYSPADHENVEVCLLIKQILSELSSISDELMSEMSIDDVMSVVSDRLADSLLGAPPLDNAVELIGWLDLPLDIAPAAIVTTFNEGFIPSSVNADVFLPNALRGELQLTDNQKRLARDTYAVRLLLESRREVRFLVARRDPLDNTLTISRLAVQGTPAEMAERLQTFLRGGQSAGQVPERQGTTRIVSLATAGRFVVPRPEPVRLPKKISVTALATYLACPYRFYLRHVLNLHTWSDEAVELDPASFGSLLHSVLHRFGESPEAEATDASLVEKKLLELLEEEALATYGAVRLPAVQVQLGQARRRLEAFARWQADWARQGWRIAHVEKVVTMPATAIPTVKNSPFDLIGRIDRIDYNAATDEWIIFDYKSSDTAKSPSEAHGVPAKLDEPQDIPWSDLQLPVYRHLARHVGDARLGAAKAVRLGYIHLPKDPNKVKEQLADWTEDVLISADEKLSEVLQRIENLEFWPPAEPGQVVDEFAWICQDTALERRLAP